MKENIEKITDEYGQLHEEDCELNQEDGSDDGCTCAVKNMTEDIVRAVVEYVSHDMKGETEEQRKCIVKMYMDAWVPFKED